MARLEHVRELPANRGAVDAKLAVFSGNSGFDDRLVRAADVRSDVELVDLTRLYSGS